MEQEKAKRQSQIFFEVHSGNTREGPGCFESTQRAFSQLKDLPENPRVLDVGCGPGRQTLDLASLTPGTIHAVDNHPPFIEALKKSAAAEGLAGRILPAVADMGALPFAPGTFDLVWSEGAIYIIGLEKGLRLWRPLLRPGGCLAVTHIAWLRDDPPPDLKAFWDQAYPAIDTIAGNAAVFQQQGYELLDRFILPERAWIEEYYRPLERRVNELRSVYAGDPIAREVLEAEDREFALYRDSSSYYGYVFFVARRP
jgi:SAM-dependent methyltransferase